jgi:hypothetical protein
MARGNKRAVMRLQGWKAPMGGASLSALLAAQVMITFVAVPLGAVYPSGHALMDVGHLVFAAVCALALTDRRAVQGAPLGSQRREETRRIRRRAAKAAGLNDRCGLGACARIAALFEFSVSSVPHQHPRLDVDYLYRVKRDDSQKNARASRTNHQELRSQMMGIT